MFFGVIFFFESVHFMYTCTCLHTRASSTFGSKKSIFMNRSSQEFVDEAFATLRKHAALPTGNKSQLSGFPEKKNFLKLFYDLGKRHAEKMRDEGMKRYSRNKDRYKYPPIVAMQSQVSKIKKMLMSKCVKLPDFNSHHRADTRGAATTPSSSSATKNKRKETSPGMEKHESDTSPQPPLSNKSMLTQNNTRGLKDGKTTRGKDKGGVASTEVLGSRQCFNAYINGLKLSKKDLKLVRKLRNERLHASAEFVPALQCDNTVLTANLCLQNFLREFGEPSSRKPSVSDCLRATIMLQAVSGRRTSEILSTIVVQSPDCEFASRCRNPHASYYCKFTGFLKKKTKRGKGGAGGQRRNDKAGSGNNRDKHQPQGLMPIANQQNVTEERRSRWPQSENTQKKNRRDDRTLHAAQDRHYPLLAPRDLVTKCICIVRKHLESKNKTPEQINKKWSAYMSSVVKKISPNIGNVHRFRRLYALIAFNYFNRQIPLSGNARMPFYSNGSSIVRFVSDVLGHSNLRESITYLSMNLSSDSIGNIDFSDSKGPRIKEKNLRFKDAHHQHHQHGVRSKTLFDSPQRSIEETSSDAMVVEM